MKFRIAILLVIFSCTLILSCKKDSSPEPSPDTPTAFQPAITPVGTPVGSPNSGVIGIGGGTITSDDGRLEINIPPNALSTDTEISIQPISNMCPGGTGNAYDLSPHGLQFNEAVSLNFQYATSDVLGSSPLALRVATQYDDGIWHGFTTMQLDETNSVLSISTTHFSGYAMYEDVKVLPAVWTMQVNETVALTLYKVIHDETEVTEELMTLGSLDIYPYTDGLVWTVNGEQGTMLDNGWMSPAIEHATSTYNAPAHINAMQSNPAAATVTLPYGNGFISVISNIDVQELGQQYTLHFEMDYASWNITSAYCQMGGGEGYLDGFDAHITVTGVGAGGVIINQFNNLTPPNNYESMNGCECLSMTFNQGSFAEFSNFSCTANSSNDLSFSYDYLLNSTDDTFQCPDQNPQTLSGVDVPENAGIGSALLPADSAIYPWGLGTLTVVHVQ